MSEYEAIHLTADDLLAGALKHPERPDSRIILDIARTAWDEGFDAGEMDAFDVMEHPHIHRCVKNPYAKEEK